MQCEERLKDTRLGPVDSKIAKSCDIKQGKPPKNERRMQTSFRVEAMWTKPTLLWMWASDLMAKGRRESRRDHQILYIESATTTINYYILYISIYVHYFIILWYPLRSKMWQGIFTCCSMLFHVLSSSCKLNILPGMQSKSKPSKPGMVILAQKYANTPGLRLWRRINAIKRQAM